MPRGKELKQVVEALASLCEQTTEKAIFFYKDRALSITYLRDYIDVGDALPEVPDLTADQRAALGGLGAVLNLDWLWVEGLMQRGELAIINCLRQVHGRTEFEDLEGYLPRLFYRIWLKEPSGLP